MHLPLFGKAGVTCLQVGGGGMGLWASRGEKVDDCRHGVLVAGAVKLGAGKKTICD